MPSILHQDFIRPWFEALEEMDEFIGIRFGYMPPGAKMPDWQFIGHDDVDGIGGFARILRGRGANLEHLPQLAHSHRAGPQALLQSIPGLFRSRKRVAWNQRWDSHVSNRHQPPVAVSWHTFSVEETQRIREASRRSSVTVNSILLAHLDSTIRRDLENPDHPLFWMVPVNLRGKVTRSTDEENHSSYITAKLEKEDKLNQIHHKIHLKLKTGQHLLTWKTYSLGLILASPIKKKLIRMNRVMSEPCLGSFSNLGQWDPEGSWTGNRLAGDWFFCPPVLRCQPIGAGCVTFQNRLTLTVQVHPEAAINTELTEGWMKAWTKRILLDFACSTGAKSLQSDG